jgi:cytochrome c biogenesis protein CcmG, thiol:disulfide interchange protein DsbE
MKSLKFILPLAVFGVLVVFLWRGLSLNPREIPSPLIGKPAPQFALPQLGQAGTTIKRDDLLGKVWVLNVWASWCAPCREEHPVVVAFAKRSSVPVYGLNYKDQPTAANTWLAQLGNPYAATLVDADGKAGIDWGVYGVPETFVIDKAGIIRMKHIGVLTEEAVRTKLEPLVKELSS